MSKRLQVVLEEEEWREIRSTARGRGVTVSEWVRSALRDARRTEPTGDVATKLESIRAAARHDLPTGDIDQMLEEIERGYRE